MKIGNDNPFLGKTSNVEYIPLEAGYKSLLARIFGVNPEKIKERK